MTGIIGGALAGVGMTAVMLAENSRRDAKRPHKEGDIWSQESSDGSPALRTDRKRPETPNTAGHFVASAGFGATYALLRRWVPGLPAAGIGTAYGAGVYAIDLADAAPLMGEGETRKPGRVAEQLALHLLFGAGTALAVAMMAPRPTRTD
ncbi:hypothetical protein KY084_05575 [Stakelama sp. CBK3Z-3]|uniref:DUF1440 domain-containing protein n=1 Tax=Stakelama flava TaxID=2860338 RepID=A0ABS6XJH5_9SPHN|nr:hypothetical protein [Stakelama flava]MBW4330341.1 hypothetical protein [Stakelama flava]